MKKILILFAICIASASLCFGRSEVSNEDMVVGAIRIALTHYQEENKGKLPRDINEISQLLDLNSEYQNKHPIYREYVYLGKGSLVKAENGNPLILIRMSPKENPDIGKGKAGRSFLYIDTKDQNLIRTGWMDEPAFQAVLKKSGVSAISQSMGSVLLKTGGGEKKGNEPTDYQKTVIQAYKEGKVPIQKRNPNGDAPSGNHQSSITDTMSPKSSTSEPTKTISQSPVTKTKTSWWLILSAFIGIIATGVMVFLLIKDTPPKR